MLKTCRWIVSLITRSNCLLTRIRKRLTFDQIKRLLSTFRQLVDNQFSTLLSQQYYMATSSLLHHDSKVIDTIFRCINKNIREKY